jgi:hypothetical protein
MLDRIQDDLGVAFAEADKIYEVLTDHQVLMDDLFKGLRHNLLDLDGKVSAHELVVNAGEGFSHTMRSAFEGAVANRLQRNLTDQSADGGFFFDPRIKKVIAADFDAHVNHAGKFLELPLDTNRYVMPVRIKQIFDETALAGDKDVQPEDLKIENLIDNTIGTYWAYLYLFSNNDSTGAQTIPSSGSVTTKMEVDFGGLKEINFIEIQPALLLPITLASIAYIDANGTAQTITINESIHNDRKVVQFRKIGTSRLTLSFTNVNHTTETYSSTTQNDVGLSDVVPEAVLRQLDGGLARRVARAWYDSNVTIDSFNGEQYQIGFDNINFGLGQYASKGVFVTTPMGTSTSAEIKTPPIKVLGLQATESRPASDTGVLSATEIEAETYDSSVAARVYYGSIEYWAIRRLFDANNNLISIDYLPILPIGVDRVEHERLLLTKKSGTTSIENAGTAMFFTNYSSGNIKVYRNGTELTYSTDWQEATDLSNSSIDSGKPMAYGIKIVSPTVGDIYTVSYNPIVSNVRGSTYTIDGTTHRTVVDLIGDTSALSFTDQLVLLSTEKNGIQIVSSDVRLLIMLRRNTSEEHLSPTVRSFTLGAGAKDDQRFESF